jgi:hypothetical protein
LWLQYLASQTESQKEYRQSPAAVLDKLHTEFVPVSPDPRFVYGPIFERKGLKEQLNYMTRRFGWNYNMFYGASGSGKSTAILEHFRGRQGVIHINARRADLKAQLAKSIRIPKDPGKSYFSLFIFPNVLILPPFFISFATIFCFSILKNGT